jgi:hypothetical protein
MSRLRNRIAKAEGNQPPPTPPPEAGVMEFTYEPMRVFHFGKAHDRDAVAAAAAEARAMLEAKGINVHPKARVQMRAFHSHDESEAWLMRQQAELIAAAD